MFAQISPDDTDTGDTADVDKRGTLSIHFAKLLRPLTVTSILYFTARVVLVTFCLYYHCVLSLLRQPELPLLALHANLTLAKAANLAVIAECFTCNTLKERTIIAFTQGKFKRRTICAFSPK